MSQNGKGQPLRSSLWWNNPADPGMTALYLERYLNYGLTREELQSGKPIIGIAQTGSDLAPCNRHHIELASRVRDGIRAAGGVPIEFPVHPIQETGKRPTAALDRNLAYLGLVEVLYSYPLDGVVLTTGCDKTTPAMMMGAATVDIPAIVLSGGPMLDGYFDGKLAGSGTAIWEARRRHAAGEIDYDTFIEIVASSAPSIGHCNTMGTASSMNAMAEALGMSLPGCAAIPAPYRERGQIAYETGKRIVAMVHEDLRPSHIMTREAFENAIVCASAIGASTNCPPHVNAIARHIGVELSNDDWDRIGYDIPLLVNMMPAGEFLGESYYRAGGLPAVIAELMRHGKIREGAWTVTGRTFGENNAGAKITDPKVIRTFADPLKQPGRFRGAEGQSVRRRHHEDFGDLGGFPPPLSPARGRRRRFRGPRRRLRRTGGLSPAHQRAGAADRRELHPGHPQLRPHRLSRRRGGGQHAAARRARSARHLGIALYRRRPAERHFGQPVDPQCLAGSGGRRRPCACSRPVTAFA